MPFNIVRNTITKVKADAIVNTANPLPTFGRGTDQKIYMAAGAEQLLKEREKIGIIERGQAAVTSAFNLNAKYLIHTVGPVWIDGNHNEISILASCFRECLRLATELNCESIAFPLISTGVYGFPKELAIKIFTSVVYDFLMTSDMLVTLVIYDDESFNISTKVFANIEDYLTDQDLSAPDLQSFEEAIIVREKQFHDYLIELMNESGLSNPEIYHAANVSRQLFSKILSNKDYIPSKNTICALGMGMRLDIETLEKLLEKAGYCLSDAKPFDLAVKHFVNNKKYNLAENNVLMYRSKLELIGPADK